MPRFVIHGGGAFLLALSCFLNFAWAAPPSDSPQKARYPALAYVTAGFIALIIVGIVAFPSRKESWESVQEKRPRGRRAGKRKHNS
jgi:hypothetical protein